MDFHDLVAVIAGPSESEKCMNALEGIESLLIKEFVERRAERQQSKSKEGAAINDITITESLVCGLLSKLETCPNATQKILQVLSLCCQNLLTKLTSSTIYKVFNACTDLAGKSLNEKNWLVLVKCLTVLKNFDYQRCPSVLTNTSRRSECLRIIHLGISIGKEEISDKNKQTLSAIRILCVETLGKVIMAVPYELDVSVKFEEWFMLLFPFLFDENLELRNVTFLTYETMKSLWVNSFQTIISCPNMKEQIKVYAKVLVQFAETNQPDWVNLWCWVFELLGDEFSDKKNIEIINKLLQVEETAFRSNNMSTRYNAYVGWKYLVHKFIKTSIEDASKRLKLLLQPLVSNNSKTHEISVIKFEVWWLLIVGMEQCMEKNGKNIIYHFLNFCFGPVTESSALNKRTNTPLPNSSLNARRCGSNTSPASYYPLVTVRKMRGLDLNRADALAQILNLDVNCKIFKLQCFQGILISRPKTFLELSKMIIYCVGQCTIVIVDSREVTSQDKKTYLKEIWKNLMLHVRSVDRMPHSEPAEGMDSTEKHEKVEMMKNLFRILLHLNEFSASNVNLLNVYICPILEIVLSAESGIDNEVLTCGMYYFGTEVLIGTPLLIMLDILLSPVIVSSQHQNPNGQNETRYMVLLNRVLKLGIGPECTSIQFTQAVMKRLDSAVGYGSASHNLVKTIWILVAKSLTCYVAMGKEVNQGNHDKADYKCLFSVLLFPVTYSKIFYSERELIAKVWSQLFQALQQNVYSSNCSYVGNEICNLWCGYVYQELAGRRGMSPHEIFYIVCVVSCAVKHIRYQALNRLLSHISGEPEKCITIHLFHCFQLLQLLVAYFQKLTERNDIYFKIMTEYAESILTLCENLQECPISNASYFFVDHIQFLLNVEVVNNTNTKKYIDTIEKVWKSFLYRFTLHYLKKSKSDEQTIVLKIQPVLKLALAHSIHSLHLTTLEFCQKENIRMEENFKIQCSSCKNSKENRIENVNNQKSPGNSSNGKKAGLKDLFNRPLTKHQREMLKERRDDIPALYQDLTQDSQPSLIDITQDYSSDTLPAVSASEKSPVNEEDLSFRSALKSIKLNADEKSNPDVNCGKVEQAEAIKSKQNRVIDSVLSSKLREIPQEILGKKENGNTPAKTKTVLVIKRTPANSLNSSTTSMPVELPEKSPQDSTDTKTSCIQSPVLTDSKILKSNVKTLSAKKEVPIMIISNLKTGNPEIKNVTLTPHIVPEKGSCKTSDVLSSNSVPEKENITMSVNSQNKRFSDCSLIDMGNSKKGNIPDTPTKQHEPTGEESQVNLVMGGNEDLERKSFKSPKSPFLSKEIDDTNKVKQMTPKRTDLTSNCSKKLLLSGEKNENNLVESCEIVNQSPRSVVKKSDSEEVGRSIRKALISENSLLQKKSGKASKLGSKKTLPFGGETSLSVDDVVPIIDLTSTSQGSSEVVKSDLEETSIVSKALRHEEHITLATPHKMLITPECSPGKRPLDKKIKDCSPDSNIKAFSTSCLENEKNPFSKFIELRKKKDSIDPSKVSINAFQEKIPKTLPRNLNRHSIIANSCEVKENAKNYSVDTTSTCNTTEVPSGISSDQTEFVKSLQLMPQTTSAVTSDCRRQTRVSTRSDWARRFGSNKKTETITPGRNFKDVGDDEKSNKVVEGPQEVVNSNITTESEDLIESSQDNVETNDSVQTACFVKVPKLVLTPGSVVTDVEGDVVIKEKLSPVSYRLSHGNENEVIGKNTSLSFEGSQKEVNSIDPDSNKAITVNNSKVLADTDSGLTEMKCEPHSSSGRTCHSAEGSALGGTANRSVTHSTNGGTQCHMERELNTAANKDANLLGDNESHLPNRSESRLLSPRKSNVSAPGDSNLPSPSAVNIPASRVLQPLSPTKSLQPTSSNLCSLTGSESLSPTRKEICSPIQKKPCSPKSKEHHSPTSREPHSKTSKKLHSPTSNELHSQTSNEVQSLSTHEPSSPTTKELHSPMTKDPHSPKGKDPCAPMTKDPLSPTPKDPRSPMTEDPRSPMPKDSHSPRRKDPRSPRRKDPHSPTHKDPHSPTRQDQLSPIHREPHSPARKEPRPKSSLESLTASLDQFRAKHRRELFCSDLIAQDCWKSNLSSDYESSAILNTETQNSSIDPSFPTSSSISRSDSGSRMLPNVDKIMPLDFNEMLNIVSDKTDQHSKNQKRKNEKPLKEIISKRSCGRAAQMVGLALTNNQNQSEPKVTSEDESDIVYVHSSEGQEKCQWVKCVPDYVCSPSRTNLKRKRAGSDDYDSSSPPKKTVRFADPVMTQELHYTKKLLPENPSEPKSTYRVVRTKKGRVYIQKNGTTMSTRLRSRRHSSSSPSDDSPVWPSLKDSTHPISDIMKELVENRESEKEFLRALNEKGVSTVGEFCLLSEYEVLGLPMKPPQVLIAKFVLKKFEESLKRVAEPSRLQELLSNSTLGPWAAPKDVKETLLSMSSDDIIHLLKENLPQSTLDEVVCGLSPPTTPEIKLVTEDKSSCTEFEVPCHQYYLVEAFRNNQCEQNSKLINEVLKVVFDNCDMNQILKELCDLCTSKPASRVSDSVEECVNLLERLSDHKASESVVLDSDGAIQNTDVGYSGAMRVLSEVCRYVERKYNGQQHALRNLVDFFVKEVLVDKERSVSVIKELLSKTETLEPAPDNQVMQFVIESCGAQAVLEAVASTMNIEQVLGIVGKFYCKEIERLGKKSV